MKMLGPPLRTSKENQFVLIVSNCYSKLIIAVPTSRKTAWHVVSFLRPLVFPYGIPSTSWQITGLNMLLSFSTHFAHILRSKHPAATASYPETNRQAKRASKNDNHQTMTLPGIISTMLRHLCAAANIRLQRPGISLHKFTTLILVLVWQPSGPSTSDNLTHYDLTLHQIHRRTSCKEGCCMDYQQWDRTETKKWKRRSVVIRAMTTEESVMSRERLRSGSMSVPAAQQWLPRLQSFWQPRCKVSYCWSRQGLLW